MNLTRTTAYDGAIVSPAKSKAQRRLMAAAEHGATFAKAKEVRATMSYAQLHDFAVGSEKGKPERVAKKKKR